MQFSFFQKFTSFFLIFFLLFSFTVRIPFLAIFSSQTYAAQESFYDLVAVVVDEEIYSEVKSKLVRYTQDIQGVLENTRAVIIPTPSTATSFDIASLHEKLYFEGYKGVRDVNFESRLVGTLLVGNIPIPVVFDGNNSSRSLLPYIDFEEKGYVYNHETQKYERHDSATDVTPEIWHGVVSPNSGNTDTDVDLIQGYFDKNHDFYRGEGVFESDKGIVNGNVADSVRDDYEPYVFYYDQFRETKALSYEKYEGYRAYLQNQEDIEYNRYTQELAEKVKNQVLGIQNENLRDLILKSIPGFPTESLGNGPDIDNTPDVQTRYITDNATNKFLEIFNEGTLSDIRKYIHNAGRYNGQGSQVNVDMAPFLISVLDKVSAQVVKNINTTLEGQIDDIVKNGLSRKIAIPTVRTRDTHYRGNNNGNGLGGLGGVGLSDSTAWCSSEHRNFYYGADASTISSAAQCSIYRGSTQGDGKLVEANRGMNIQLSQADIGLCGSQIRTNSNGTVTAGIQGYWGGNTPINLDKSSLGTSGFQLENHDLKGGIRPVFDIVGSVERTDESKNPSPLDCFDNNFIHTYNQSNGFHLLGFNISTNCGANFQAPVAGRSPSGAWSCSTTNTKATFPETFENQYASFKDNQSTGTCTTMHLDLDGTRWTRGSTGFCGLSSHNERITEVYSYKTIPSYIEHKSPTNEEFGAQVSALSSPDLPVDTDRYIDFIGANGNYGRIDYPHLFRVGVSSDEVLTLENVSSALEEHLDTISTEINNTILDLHPNTLSGNASEIYGLLATGDYPSANVDLHNTLRSRSLETLTVDGDSKQVSYYDTLVFAIYWNNLKTVSGKYKFIFENYLSDQFHGNNFLFPLPKNKKSYEITYIGAPGDSQNMYVKLDPQEKANNPYASVIARNIALNTSLLSSNVFSPNSQDGVFQCAPPDGVPIWEWIPAIVCRLQSLLPPTIGISEGACGPSLLSQEEQEEILACQGDVNKNGISDCIEGKLEGGTLELVRDASKYYYNSVGILGAVIRDKNDAVVTLDSVSYVDFELQKLEIPDDPLLEFTVGNTKTIYDANDSRFSSLANYKEAQKYISFQATRSRVAAGKSRTYFSAKRSDVNASFIASLEAQDHTGDTGIYLESDVLDVQVRGDRLFLNSYIMDGASIGDVSPVASTLEVSDAENVFLIDTNQQYVEDVAETIYEQNTNEEKAILALTNYSKNGNILSVEYPLSVEIRKGEEILYQETNISSTDLSTFKPLSAIQTSGTLDILVTDSSGYSAKKTIDFTPSIPSQLDIQLGTSVSQTGGNLTTHLVSFLDRFGNVTSGDIYTLDMSISGGGVEFYDTRDDVFSTKTVEGYKIFRLNSTSREANSTINFSLKDASGETTLISESATIRSVEDIDIRITSLSEDIYVGGDTYNFDVELTDASGNRLSDFDSRAYMVLNPTYGVTLEPYVEIRNGVGVLQLQTSTIAEKQIPLEFQVEGMNEIVKEYIDILPDVPIKLDLSLSRDKIEASSDDSTYLYAILKDRFGNEVFTDDTTQLDVEIPSESVNIITLPTASTRVSEGRARFEIRGTDIPGIGYFKVGTTPSLDDNFFVLDGQAPFEKSRLTIPTMKNSSGLTETGKKFYKEFNSATYITKFTSQYLLEENEDYQALPSVLQQQVLDLWKETNQLVVNGVGENAGSVETFYFWNEEHISGNSYNGIYSVLLGAPYGDVTQENYLGGALLFDEENKSLAVTSILNNPYKYADILSFSKNGNIQNISGTTGDITQDIQLRPLFDSSDRMYVDIFNEALGTYVGKAYYNLGETELIECEGNVASCISDDRTSTVIRVSDDRFSLSERGDDMVLKNSFGSDVVVFADDGTIERKSNVYFEQEVHSSLPYLLMNIKSGSDTIGQFVIHLVDGKINVTRSESLLQNKLATLDNTLIVYLKTNQYGTRDIFEKNGDTRKIIFYNDPFASRYVLDDFHSDDASGIENFYEQKGIGWEQENKALLAFSAGESVGESTKKYFSFSLINLGDPVVSLKKLKRTFINAPSLEKSFDSTIGSRISGDDSVVGYQLFDYNNDDKDDIVLIKTDGYIELLENEDIDTYYLPKGNLVIAADGGAVRLVKTGNFTGDNYDDIFFVSDEGEPFVFNNHIKDFVRIPLAEQMDLEGAIIQAEVFDMDNDGTDDIVTLDDAGQIHIFYGGGNPEAPEFTKLKIGDGYGIKLSDTLLSRGGAVYFDELPQVNNEAIANQLITSNEEFQAELQNTINGSGDEPSGEFFHEYLADRLLFVDLPYTPYTYDETLTPAQNTIDVIDAGIETTNYPELDAQLEQSVSAIENFINDNNSYINFNTSYGHSRTSSFLRSEYADTQGLTIEKKFIDLSPEFLQTGDIVEVELRLHNTGTKRLNNIAFVDTIPRNFTLESSQIEVVSQDGLVITPKPGIGIYDMLIDGFFMNPGEEVILTYKLRTLPLKYGYIQAGLFEEGELGDDPYGDVTLKPDNLNCGEEIDIFTSTAPRSYTKGKKAPTCEEDKLKLPDNVAKNALDDNGNGVPDYIDDLVGGPQGNVLDYARGVLDDMHVDSDGDGVPDSDDPLPNIDEDGTDILSAINEINETVDEISEEIDTVIEGFSCGFGGGSCIATPLNWAPLAPGGDPTLFGYPVGDGLRVGEGIPVFSALTGLQMVCGTSPCCIPTTYPVSPLGFVPGPVCGAPSAGGYLGTWAPTNYVRLFATPTLTGGAGIAACFGGPAIVQGNIPPPGVHPIAPGGNCVVAAAPLLGCEGEEGDPRIVGNPWQYPQYGVINANCPAGVKDEKVVPPEIDNDFVGAYLDYKKTGVKTPSLVDSFKDAFGSVAKGGGNWNIPSGPLVNIGGGGDTDMSLAVDFDVSALSSGNFEDVVKVQNTRIAPFPDFLMDWVTRQLEEVVNKLTNLPKVFVILPDFSGIFDYGWDDFDENVQKSFNSGKESRQAEKSQYESRISALRGQKSSLDCADKDSTHCGFIDSQISQLQQKKNFGTPETLSGIKAAYEFLGNVPLVQVEPETISVNIPWVDGASLERAALDWQFTLDQWRGELDRAAAQWSGGVTCNHDNAADQAACKAHNEAGEKLALDANKLIGSLEKNLEIIEEYKRLPEKLNKLISIKEVRLEQILCNIEAISSLIGGWIDTNGERFKAWVELFVLIKSILKSWQLLIDVFQDYDEECHQCKNERQDLQTFIWKLIGGVIPKVPIIQFPKWPDIILDLHNVRAGMTIYLPDFDINLRPIVLPMLPELRLPDAPNLNIELPELPILPEFSIPELPELPALPTVELPDLPPPPKIPKLFGAVEGILNIMKLVTKVMCIIKQSPFVPEWRAGDQISYITERNGYLSFDFIDITLPQFSYPFVDAIKVTTYVNFEFETEFIMEAVRQITAPLDTFTNDIANMFDIHVPDIDFSGNVIDDIDIDVTLDGEVNEEGVGDISQLKGTTKGFQFIALLLASKVRDLVAYVDAHKDVTLTNKDFIAYVNENLASQSVSENPRMNEIRALWEDVNNLTYSKEDALIEALQENRKAKFDALESILTTELQNTKQLRDELQNIGSNSYVTQVAFENTSNIVAYNETLESYNEKLIKSAVKLVEGDSEYQNYRASVQETGDEIIQEVRGGLDTYRSQMEHSSLLAAQVGTSESTQEASSCSYGGVGEYEYTYEGLYVLEFDRHYRLFEYLDELRGDEITTPTDVDGDGDDDLLYMANNQLFLKENLKEADTKVHVSLPPLILGASENMFYNGDTYYEAVNYFEEAAVADGYINVNFDVPTDTSVDNFRMEFYTIVDKFRHLGDSDYIPTDTKKFVVDALADIEDNTFVEQTPNYTLGKHTAYISGAGVIAGAKLTNTQLINIRDDLDANNIVTLTSGSPLSAGKNSFTIEYYTTSPEQTQELTVPNHSYVSFPELTHIVGLSGNAYTHGIISEEITGAGIVAHIGKPLLPGAKIVYEGNGIGLTASSHIDITYADGSQIALDMREVDDYRLYDLGTGENDQHLIRLKVPNDFYYAKLHAFKQGIHGTNSQQILLAPQKQADTQPPQIGLNQKIRIPVYQKQIFDFTPYIYEDSGIDNITDISIDFDFETDNNGDGNFRNDRDEENMVILQTPTSIKVEFGEYDELFEKQIRLTLTDANGNIGYKDIDFEVYPPAPQIQEYEDSTLKGVIDETLLDEPIRMYRVRGGAIKKLENAQGTDLVDTNEEGAYGFEVPETTSGLALEKDGDNIATINEYTGQITLQNPLANTSMLASNHPDNTLGFPRIAIDMAGEELFYEYIQPKFDSQIDIISSVDEIEEEGIYVRVIDQELYRTFTIPVSVGYNPGAVILYLASDEDKEPVFSVFRDGRVYSHGLSRYILKYTSLNDMSTYILHDSLNQTDIAQVILNIEGSYILK